MIRSTQQSVGTYPELVTFDTCGNRTRPFASTGYPLGVAISHYRTMVDFLEKQKVECSTTASMERNKTGYWSQIKRLVVIPTIKATLGESVIEVTNPLIAV